MGRHALMSAKWLPRFVRSSMARRFMLVFGFLGLVCFFSVINLSFNSGWAPRDSRVVKAEIVHLSEEYVKALAKENGDIVDGPYAGRFTAFDLKKTIAVLLESMLVRLGRLELIVNNITNGSVGRDNHTVVFGHSWVFGHQHQHSAADKGLSAVDLLKGKSEKCELTDEDRKMYPHCEAKIAWMRRMWKSDACYKNYGVDGSDCSIIMYLSEVEGFCPRQVWSGENKTMVDTRVVYANFTTELQPLMELLKDPNERQGYAWIRMRISRMWTRWKQAGSSIAARHSASSFRPKQKILVHLGLLSKQSGWKFAEMQFKGGPLGELVQWSDLISCLYILGHELKVTSEVEQLVEILNHVPAAKSPCQSRKELPVHLIYTDIMGLNQLKKRLKAGYAKFSCLFRVVDSFGTEPAFNHRIFAKQNKILSSWGGLDLNPRQFFTMFPHSPDNSFMGFVVERPLNETSAAEMPTKKNIALVYGKNDYMWQGKRSYLDVIRQHLDIHGTVYVDSKSPLKNVPSYVINHGILSGVELHKLLQQTKIFIGLGFPYEGPAALEAIANGAVYLNPVFNPPHSSKNNKFFKGKPTHREISSQHPYAETFIGAPHVYSLNITEMPQVEATIKKILDKNEYTPYLPFEYTEEGMLQRMNAFIQHQDFCSHSNSQSMWPPRESVDLLFATAGKSCKNFCWESGKICEPSYFPVLNTQEAMKNFTSCSTFQQASNIYYPAVDPNSKTCTRQNEPLLFSCVGSMDKLRRLCPCRTFIRGQTALCIGCDR